MRTVWWEQNDWCNLLVIAGEAKQSRSYMDKNKAGEKYLSGPNRSSPIRERDYCDKQLQIQVRPLIVRPATKETRPYR